MLKPLTFEQMAASGIFGKVVGQATNIWEFTDDKNGEVMEGVKVTFFGGSHSVRFEDPKQLELIHEGDFITWEGPATIGKTGIKFGHGRLLELNGAVIKGKPLAAATAK